MRSRELLIVVGAAVVVLCFLLARDRIAPEHPIIASQTSDYVAFYCAGKAVDNRADPYRIEPIRACEHAIAVDANKPQWVATPAPFPGYALAVYAVLAKLPYLASRTMWIFLSLLSAGAAVWALWKLTAFPPLVITLLVAPTMILVNVLLGESTPIVVAALAVAAYAARVGRLDLAGGLVPIAMLEPQIGLPALVSVALYARASRLPVGIGCIILAAISAIAIGVRGNVAYFAAALPLQAASEIAARSQFSLTHAAYLMGVPSNAALLLGSASYAVMLVVGVASAGMLARRTGNAAYLVLLPPAAVLLGGSFIHESQMVAAIPVAMLMAADAAIGWQPAVLSLALLTIRWTTDATSRLELAMLAVTALAIGYIIMRRLPAQRRSLLVAFAAPPSLIVLFVLLHFGARGTLHSVAPQFDPVRRSASDYAALSWSDYVNRGAAWLHHDPRFELEKLPTVAALIVLVMTGVTAARVTARA